jgi:glutamate dehydrogenase
VLEENGVLLYKDASTNKGGVTSSSLEVFAALALDDETFAKHMAVSDEHNIPPFYLRYVQEIHRRIETDADLEFECIWRENLRTGTHRYLLTDQVSDKINQLNDSIQNSSLWNNVELRRNVMLQAIPPALIELVGLDKIIERTPDNYLKAIFGAHLASRYVYKYGLDANEMLFFMFMQSYHPKALIVDQESQKPPPPHIKKQQIGSNQKRKMPQPQQQHASASASQ